MKKHILIALFTSYIIILIPGCIKKDKFGDPIIPIWKPDVAVPLVNSDLSMKDLISETNDGKISLSTDADGLYMLTYRDTAFSELAENVIIIPDQTMVIPVLPASNTPHPLLLSFNFTNPNNNNFQGNLKTAELKAGDLSLNLVTNDPSSFTVTLSFPTILNKSNGSAFTISKNTNGALSFSLTGDLSQYVINFNANNQLDFTIAISGMSGVGTLAGTLNMLGIKYRLLEGTFSTISLGGLPGSNDISIFSNILTGGIYFEDPSVTFTFQNYFGVDVTTDLNYLRSIDKANVQTDIDAGELEGTNTVQKSSTVGSYGSSSFEVNSTNSTTGGGKTALKDVLSTAPQVVEYSVNPYISSSSVGFVKDDSRIQVAGELKIPFYGSISNYALQDTFDLELNFLDDVNLESVEFDIHTENKVPVELMLQVYFIDTTNNWIRLDSFFVDNKPILKAPTVDNNGLLISPGVDQLVSSFNKEDLQNLKPTNKLIVRASMKTPNAPTTSVKIFDKSNLHIKISARAKGDIDLN
jgi:hypothetical protein